MRIPRLYTPQLFIQGQELSVSGQTAHHIANVLRIRSGAPVLVFDGKGSEHRATVKATKRSEIILEIAEPAATLQEPSLDITLLQGIARNDRMDFILQKAVELGVRTIQPLWMQRSQSRLKGSRLDKRCKHWQGVIISACEQCGRATLPHLGVATNFSDWVNSQKSTGLRLLLEPNSDTGLGTLQPRDDKITMIAGPEGGLNDHEQLLAASAGFIGIRLGPRILRTETAALAALAGIQTLWGDYS
jgi:16S rRNA (uracil1498-N3)-methyltransferase